MISFLLAAAAAAAQPILEWKDQPYRTRSTPSIEVPLEAARLQVAGAGDSRVELAVFRMRSTAAQPGPPTVYLHGGPGGASIEHLESPDFRAVFAALRAQGDVILFDQRGCGDSLPSLIPRSVPRIREDTLGSRESFLAYLVETSGRVRGSLEALGHAPADFTLVQSVADVEALRRALGVERIHLFGHSYGAQLAQEYVRRHPDAVARVILAGPRGMDTARKFPADADAVLARIAALARADATVGAKFPDLLATFDRVLAKLDREPVAVEIEGPEGKFVLRVGGYALRFIIAKFYLNDPDNYRYLPKLLDELDTGRRPWSLVFNLGQMLRSPVSYAWFTTDAATGASAARSAEIARQAGSARLRDAMNFPFPDINEAWGVPNGGDALRAPVVNDRVPVLGVVGTLDGITPPAQAREVLAGFSNSRLLEVANAGHNSMFRAPGVAEAMADFLAGREPPPTAVLPPVPFMPLVAARR